MFGKAVIASGLVPAMSGMFAATVAGLVALLGASWTAADGASDTVAPFVTAAEDVPHAAAPSACEEIFAPMREWFDSFRGDVWMKQMQAQADQWQHQRKEDQRRVDRRRRRQEKAQVREAERLAHDLTGWAQSYFKPSPVVRRRKRSSLDSVKAVAPTVKATAPTAAHGEQPRKPMKSPRTNKMAS